MPKNNFIHGLLMMGLSWLTMAAGHAQTAPAAPAVSLAAPAVAAPPKSVGAFNAVTVEAIVKTETEALASGARSPSAAGGSTSAAGAAPKKAAPKPLQADVLSIYGPANKVSADLVSGGAIYRGVQTGSVVDSCSVIGIANRCVVFEPRGKTPASMCPSACWTGIRQDADPVPAAGSGMAMPAPLPIERSGIPPPGSRAASLKGITG